MKSKDKLYKITKIKTLDDLLKRSVADVLREPNVGIITVQNALKELVEEKLGKQWYGILWKALLEDLLEEKTGTRCNYWG